MPNGTHRKELLCSLLGHLVHRRPHKTRAGRGSPFQDGPRINPTKTEPYKSWTNPKFSSHIGRRISKHDHKNLGKHHRRLNTDGPKRPFSFSQPSCLRVGYTERVKARPGPGNVTRSPGFAPSGIDTSLTVRTSCGRGGTGSKDRWSLVPK